jgi:probable HAF family extracellular repeat protein
MQTRVAVILSVVLFLAVSESGSAQQPTKHLPRYNIINLGTLGGTFSEAWGINNLGGMGGTAALPDDTSQRAVLWLSGLKIDLGTLGGPNSAAEIGPNVFAQLPGWAETSVPDPSGEDFCGFGTHLTCLPFLWEFGVMVPLPTLGGNNGQGFDINNAGQVVGGAETNVHDPTCTSPQVLQTLPAVWVGSHVQSLPTLAGDPDGNAFGNNDRGDVVGVSGTCSNLAAHAVLWRNGRVTNLGSLGGVMNNIALAINDRGEVVGYSDLPGDITDHAFLWRHGRMTDLGTLAGDDPTIQSVAFAINNRTQVVGYSCGGPGGNCGAFLWQNGKMTDLNSLFPPNTTLYASSALGINDEGAIVGQAYDPTTGDSPAYLAIPSRGGEDSQVASPIEHSRSFGEATLPQHLSPMGRRISIGR